MRITNHSDKLTAEHLSRKAVVYLRQSSEQQVRMNTESQRLQYSLVDRAREMGFQQIDVIDDDLGASAALGAKERKGFQRLIAAVNDDASTEDFSEDLLALADLHRHRARRRCATLAWEALRNAIASD